MNKHKNLRYSEEGKATTAIKRTVSRGWRSFIVLLVIFFSLLTVPWGQVMADSVTLAFETEGLNLATGTVVKLMPRPVRETAQADFYIAYNADVTPHAVLVLRTRGNKIVYLKDIAFKRATTDSIGKLKFGAKSIDQPLKQSDSVVLSTADGSLYKIGDVVEGKTSVTLSYIKLK